MRLPNKEIWRQSDTYPMLDVSNRGRVRGHRDHNIRMIREDPYMMVDVVFLKSQFTYVPVRHLMEEMWGDQDPDWVPSYDPERVYSYHNYTGGIYCVELDVEYPSAAAAARDLHLDRSSITRSASGDYETCGGYHFKRVEDM